MQTPTTTTVTYCAECDAKPGECEHRGRLYLDPVVYTRAEAGGWIVPEHEQHRFHNPPVITKAPPPAAEPVAIQQLIVQLEEHIYLDEPLETKLRTAYEHDPHRVTRLAESVILAARAGNSTNPGGLLNKLLTQLPA